MSHSIAYRLHRFERASIAYLAVLYIVLAGVLAAEWAHAVATLASDLGASRDTSVLELEGVP